MDFGSGVFHVDGDAPLTQEQVDAVWLHLPATGASWVERGHLFVQQHDGATAFNLGPVEPGIKGVSDSIRLHGKAGVKKSKTHHSTRKAQRHHATKKSPAQLDREIAEALAQIPAETAAQQPFYAARLGDRLRHVRQTATAASRLKGRGAKQAGRSAEQWVKYAERALIEKRYDDAQENLDSAEMYLDQAARAAGLR